jgi:hypothetical protein
LSWFVVFCSIYYFLGVKNITEAFINLGAMFILCELDEWTGKIFMRHLKVFRLEIVKDEKFMVFECNQE